MARIRENRTYRVRQLPSHIDSNHLPALLISVENSIGPLENINVHSLAGSLNTFEDIPTKTATVTFGAVPTAFDNDQTEWVLQSRRLGLQKNIIFDTHFFGFTALNDVDPNVHALDCIAISGLASHPFGSWKQRDDGNTKSNFMWLRDQLPRDLKQIRSILYGYDTKLLMSESFQTVEDLALSFIARLDSIGRSSVSAKPLIVLAHSLGGIVLKRALVEMANGNTKQNFMLDAIRMVLLFGVPNQGMRMSHLLPMVEGKPNAGLVEILSQESTYLTRLDEQFNGISLLRKIRLVSVIETARTRVPVQSVEGEWSKNGPFEILVDRTSAIQCQSTKSDIIPINHDHSSLVKFPENSPDYYIIAGKLRDAADDLTSEGPREESNSGLQDGKGPAFDPWSFVSSLSSPFPWKRKVRTLEMDNPDAPQHALHRQDPKAIQGFQVEAISVKDIDKHAEETSNIQSKSTTILNGIHTKRLWAEMIGSLYLNETEDRWKEIDENYGSTFEWLWTRNELGFRSWLQEDHGGYWISGKPGSGKSTLMKYIYTRCRNENDSQTLTRRQGQFCIGFFFHNRGSFVQKSFEGLLHSILHQILTLEPRLGKEILPVYLQQRDLQGNTWLLKDLIQAFSRILEQEIIPVDICLFLDALDEYNGPPENIAGFVQSIIARPDNRATKRKICFSSRPWNSFVDMFGSCAGFKIHEHTRQDVQKYISGRLADNPSTAMLLASKNVEITTGMAELSLEIMEAAEGVFLWLKLVMDNLVKAHAEGASLGELAQHLSAFPKDLEYLYRNIIQRIPYDFRQESYWMLEIVLRSEGRLAIPTFIDCLICAPCETLKECVAKLHLESAMQRTPDSIIRRLKSRCGGLLELVDSEGGYMLQFMHQTVKDFISLPGFQKLITHEGNTLTEQNGYTLLSKSFIAVAFIKLRKSHSDQIGRGNSEDWVEQLWDATVFLHKAEVSTGRSQRPLLDEADRAMSSSLERDSDLPNENLPFNSILSLCVASNLYLYVQETLEKRYVKSKPPPPLLHCVILCARDIYNESPIPLGDLGQMITLLLSHGADLKALWKGSTPFQALFQNRHLSEGIKKTSWPIFQVVSAMLSGGQDPNEDIRVQRYRDRGPVSVGSKAIHVADHKLAQLLLQYNADIDAVDRAGNTALDLCLLRRALASILESEQDTLKTAVLLSKNGACVATARQSQLDSFTHRLMFSGYCRADIDCVSSAPRLSMRRRILPRISGVLKHKNR